MSVSKKLLISLALIATVGFGWWQLMVAPHRVNESFFRPDRFEITADVDGKPLPDRMGFGEPLPIRFRCPVPDGVDKTAPLIAMLQICHPSTYKGAATVEAFQQIHGGPKVSLTIHGTAGLKDVAPPFPQKNENIYQFCVMFQGKSLQMKDIIGVPLEMHLWMSVPGKTPQSSGTIGEDIVWVFRHPFEFVDDSLDK